MEFRIEVSPNAQAIDFVDAVMKNYVETYELPCARELCFVLHEFVINAVEAMTEAGKPEQLIEVHVVYDGTQIQMTVIDKADGIPEDQWQEVLTYNFEEMADSDRGRGLFFVQHMMDHIWFKHVAPNRFLVGASKKLKDIGVYVE